VATNGSDSADGSACHPWATINHAASLAKAGWTIHVAPGTYPEDVVTQASGTSTARIRFISDQRWGAKVVGQGANNAFQVGSGGNGSYVDVIGFDVSGASSSRIGIATYSHDLRILGNRVHDVPGVGSTASCFAGAGIFIGTGPLAATTNVGSNLVDSNYVYNIATNNIPFPQQCNQAHGIYVGTPSNKVSNNLVFHSAGYGIQVYGHVSNEVVSNNTTFYNGKSGIVIGSDGTMVDDYTTVNNNISVNNGATYSNAGIQEVSYPSGYIGSHNVYSNNLTYGNSGGNYDLTVSSPVNALTSGTNSATFVNYTGNASGDYHLLSGSTAIDSGTSSAAPTLDFSGGNRPTGLKWDIGAYEYGASAPGYNWW
jgi:hypothetical protein